MTDKDSVLEAVAKSVCGTFHELRQLLLTNNALQCGVEKDQLEYTDVEDEKRNIAVYIKTSYSGNMTFLDGTEADRGVSWYRIGDIPGGGWDMVSEGVDIQYIRRK
jgi:hypothetical protein